MKSIQEEIKQKSKLQNTIIEELEKIKSSNHNLKLLNKLFAKISEIM